MFLREFFEVYLKCFVKKLATFLPAYKRMGLTIELYRCNSNSWPEAPVRDFKKNSHILTVCPFLFGSRGSYRGFSKSRFLVKKTVELA